MPNTICIGDDLALIAHLESAFGITLTDADESEPCETAGDLHALLLKKVPHVERGPIPCASASVFRRLKRTIEEQKPGLVIRPGTELGSVVPENVPAWWAAVYSRSGLRLPPLEAHPIGALLFWPVFLSPLLFALVFDSVALFGFFVSGPLAGFMILGRYLPGWCNTVGDLSRIAAGLNMASLLGPDRPMRPADVWIVMEAILRENSSGSDLITPETRLDFS